MRLRDVCLILRKRCQKVNETRRTERWFTAPCSSSLLFIFIQLRLSSAAETRCVTASAEELGATRCSWFPTERCLHFTGIQLFLFLIWPGTWMRFIFQEIHNKMSKIQHVFMWGKCAYFISSGSTWFRKSNYCFVTPDIQIHRLCREVTLGRPTARVVAHCSCFWSATLSPWSREVTGELRAHREAAYYATLRS